MSNQDKTKQQLLSEIEQLHCRIDEIKRALKHPHDKKVLSLEEITRAIAENSIDAIAMAQEGKIIFVNDAYCQIFGYSKNDLIGQSLCIVVAPEDLSLIEERANKRIKGEKVPSHYTFTGMKKDGSELVIEVSTRECFLYNIYQGR